MITTLVSLIIQKSSHWLALPLVAALIIGTAPVGATDTPSPAKPATAPALATRRPPAHDLETSLTALVQRTKDHKKMVGLAIGVIDHGRLPLFLNFGELEAGRAAAPTADTLFEIGSITKVFTASSLAALVTSGTVKLDDPVTACLPKTVTLPTAGGGSITLAHLASHTSGLPRLPPGLISVGSILTMKVAHNPYKGYSEERLFRDLARIKLAHKPGEAWEYSNLGVGLLGVALARRQGVSYEALVRELVIQPLGLKDTAVSLTPEQAARLAPGYYGNPALGFAPREARAQNWELGAFGGAGALKASARDLLRFAEAQWETTSPLRAAFALTHQPRFKESENLSIGLAWLISRDAKLSEPALWHNGGTGGYCSFMGLLPRQRCAVVILSNCAAFSPDELGFAILCALDEEPSPASRPRP